MLQSRMWEICHHNLTTERIASEIVCAFACDATAARTRSCSSWAAYTRGSP